jgi:hypothetical protein
MRIQTSLKTLALALPLAFALNGCLLIPQIEDRVVELAVGHAILIPFNANGSTNFENDANTVDMDGGFDLASVLDDAGLDASDVKDVKVASVSYRITRAEAGRSIDNGQVEFKTFTTDPGDVSGTLGAPPTAGYTQLVTNFSGSAASTTGWIAVPLASGGVAALNTLLGQFLNDVKTGQSTHPRYLVYHVYGTSNPGGTPTDFDWEFRLQLSIVGTFKTKVVN